MSSQIQSKLSFLPLKEIKNSLQAIDSDTIIFITDSNLWDLYRDKINLELIETDKKVIRWIAPAGELCKTFGEYEKCIEYIIGQGVHRNAHLVAMGGGALSDFAGLIAATLLRGINWSIISTSLLAMVDASIGGKVAINSKFGKNLIGNFHLPQNVWIDSQMLSTLPKVEVTSGLGEIVKYAFLSKEVYSFIENKVDLGLVIKECASFKQLVVEEDLLESKKRKILNFGHTFGHAFERIYDLSHGVAVAWGIYYMFKLFDEDQLLETFAKVTKLLKVNEQLQSPPWEHKGLDVDLALDYVGKDKKVSDNKSIDLVLIDTIGVPRITKMAIDDLKCKMINLT